MQSPQFWNHLSRPGTLGIAYGFVALLLLIFADQLSIRYKQGEFQVVIDDVCGGIVAGLLVFWYDAAGPSI